ncbi:OmpA/MotB family protein [Avibacterium avium]|uniref:OmpA family protein n=1 Tax=Avibacterium paragallinarum TaxID=728 RepID=A0ABU7QPQ5_AVIPA|nr:MULTISPECIES: OmpA family protein [Avibacterium]MCW9715208.1 OmpA family protein [Avibacterium sp. 21-594]
MNINFSKLIKSDNQEDSQWLPVSDLMSGLMILFLFIAIGFILNTKKVAENYQDKQKQIYQALEKEFFYDLTYWKAKIDQGTLTFVFTDPEVLFKTGDATLQERFKLILNEFFPRYIKVINQYQDSIEEVRIEGHTSSEWNVFSQDDEAYFENMRLSQDRTRAVLYYIYNLSEVEKYRSWMKENISAVGLSSSKIIKDSDGNENKEASKRVTFRIITNAEEQLRKLSEMK